jgi:excreted virulence factor EspC (type VII ESX diderm)
VLVNPGLLRAFAAQVDTASAAVRSADVGHNATTAADGIPGSTTQWAMRVVGEHMAQQANDIAKNVTQMGVAVRGAGDKYEVEDNALAGAFDGLF